MIVAAELPNFTSVMLFRFSPSIKISSPTLPFAGTLDKVGTGYSIVNISSLSVSPYALISFDFYQFFEVGSGYTIIVSLVSLYFIPDSISPIVTLFTLLKFSPHIFISVLAFPLLGVKSLIVGGSGCSASILGYLAAGIHDTTCCERE